MLAKITITKGQRKPAKARLFWRKTINPIFDFIFSATIFHIEILACMRRVFHDRYPSDASQHAELVFALAFALSAQRLTVCVTRAGAGGGTPSDWENAEA